VAHRARRVLSVGDLSGSRARSIAAVVVFLLWVFTSAVILRTGWK
jgi:hypothetical protein